ncbi:MAG: phosphoribosyltransferase [Candidatus Peregrinibacteria bacterium Gr01-1014_25]|nr:MAG: phosphoribosyltransferase [Candidatus Peregrinibacteria bacterium Gr01-1014_25]
MLFRLLDLLAPRISLTGMPGAWVTLEERRELLLLHPVFLDVPQLRKQRIRHLDLLVAGCSYAASPLVRTAVRRLKYHAVWELTAELAPLLTRACRLLPIVQGAALCPVPLHWTRRFARGFNQAEMLAHVLGQAINRPVQSLLVRTRPTGAQARRTHADRRRAMQEAFAAIADPLPRCVVLVDDVATSGATLDACASVLKKRGVERVYAAVVALG